MGKLLEKAIIIATKAHSGQVDKAGESYVLHPIRVMLKLKSEDEKIVGVLHDVIEDTQVTYDDLRKEGFSEVIIEALKRVTKIDGEDYMDFVKRAKENQISSKVKLADLEDNMDINRIANPTEKDYKRIEKYKKAKAFLLSE
ncbi:MAG: GTP pyrophosphokinase [Clostridiaceae bacterium]